MSSGLLPCPHCDSIVLKVQAFGLVDGGATDEVFIECDDCGSRGPIEIDYTTACCSWNERKNDHLSEKFKKAEELITKLRDGFEKALDTAKFWRDQAFETQARNKQLTLEANRFAACRHQVRLMPEDGTEDDFVAAVDAYRDEHGL